MLINTFFDDKINVVHIVRGMDVCLIIYFYLIWIQQ